MAEISNSHKNNFQITNPIRSSLLQKIINQRSNLSRTWIISPKGEETEIHLGDIIKLGRVRLKFDKIVLKNQNNNLNITNINPLATNVNPNNDLSGFANAAMGTITNINNSVNDSNAGESFRNNTEGQYCRICYRVDSDISNPLISPCKCSGSMSYIHYLCLKKCLDIKMQKKVEDNYILYTWKNFECEICKEEYPKYFQYQNNLYSLVDMEVTFDEYVSCDYSLFDDAKKKTFRRGLLVFQVEEGEEVTLGRTTNNKIKLKDISVSRAHCYIIKRNNKIYIVDKGSKFGTLLYLNKDLVVEPGAKDKTQTANLSSGKHCFNINVTKTWNLFSFLNFECCQSKNNDLEYIIDEEGDTSKNKSDREQMLSNFGVNHGLNDSYDDYIMNITSQVKIIEGKEEKENKEKVNQIANV